MPTATDAWREASNRRLMRLLGVSFGLHAAVLAWVHRPDGIPAPVGAASLVATLRPATLLPSPAQAPVVHRPQSLPPPELRARPPRPQPVARRASPRLAVETAPKPAPAVARAELAATEEPVAASKSTPAVATPAPAPASPAAPLVASAAPAEPPAPQAALALSAPAQSALVEAYGRHLAELLRRQQEYPRIAALRGWEGEVRLRVRVARKGSLVGVQVDRSSGFDVLDQHAQAMVEHLPTLPPLPAGLLSNEIQFVVPVHYHLEKPT
jgi:periplasmic protein TonB